MTAMKHTLSGSLVAKVICKVTTEEMCAPKRKHLEYLVQWTFEPRLSVPNFADYLVGRTQHSNLVVVIKALINIHHLMQKRRGKHSEHVTKQAKQDTSGYREAVERSVAFDATYNELVNSVLRVAHLHLYRDLIRLYAVYNEAMINLIGRDFTMSKLECRTSLATYKSFLRRMESMTAFVKIAEATDTSGIAYPKDTESITLQPVPKSSLEALEQHLAYIGGNTSRDKTPSSNLSEPSLSTLHRFESDFARDLGEPSSSAADPTHHTPSGDSMLTEAERRRIIGKDRAVSDAEANMRMAEEKLKKLSTDTEFFDLFSSSTATGESATAGLNESDSPWTTQRSTAGNPWHASTGAGNQPTLTNGNQALVLLDFADPLSATGTNASGPIGQTSVVPFVATSTNNPFVSSAAVQSVTIVQPIMNNPWPIHHSSYLPVPAPAHGNDSTATEDKVKSESNPAVSESTSLDARLAQLAGNPTVGSNGATVSISSSMSSTPSSSTQAMNGTPAAMYRAPDGSLTALN
ncbi:Phosphatidylinositol-binding clathrin assembly protein LAP [Fasciola gigantica]|uniref:Phosphatidylinositol-binding clathrin assembly protein LAP n=1 Tax=Fasciola gigantica TaxID=46835 RepID=A0A504YTH1_FASGI|nr:Phosphatidylinositol-binding clathrin assembly protein LAP [Fasciola gigantica]